MKTHESIFPITAFGVRGLAGRIRAVARSASILFIMVPLMAVEVQPAPAPLPHIEGPNLDGMTAINVNDPITGDPIDPRVGTYCIVIPLTDPRAPVSDLSQTMQTICLGFSSNQSLASFIRAERWKQERMALDAVHNRVERQLHLAP